MLCDICHNKKARIYYTEIVNGEKREQHLCEECAAEHTSFTIKNVTGKELPIGDILSGLLENYAKGMEIKANNELICQCCGMTASEFLKRGKFGCRECYKAFRTILDKNFITIQGADTHTGKRPKSRVPVINGNTGEDEKKANVKADKKSVKGEKTKEKKPSKEEMIADLRTRLQLAVKKEDYEEAARLRDEIKRQSEVVG